MFDRSVVRGQIDYIKYNTVVCDKDVMPPKGILAKMWEAVKETFSIHTTHRLELKEHGHSLSLAMREVKPSFLGASNWVKVNLTEESGGIKPVYININSLRRHLEIPAGVIQAGDISDVLNRLTEPVKEMPASPLVPRTFADMVAEINEGQDPPLVTEADMQAAVDYVSSHRDRLGSQLGGKDYIVIPKSSSHLKFNLEYHKDGVTFLRYAPNFVKGSYKEGSRVVDLTNGQLMVKAKIVVNHTENVALANQYRVARAAIARGGAKLRHYRTKAMTFQEAKREAASGMGLRGVLQTHRFVAYTKAESNPDSPVSRVNKAAIYTLQQKGPVSEAAFSTDEERREVAKGLIANVHALHEQGYCHNDIKEENFLYTKVNGKINTNLIDMGFATRLSEFDRYRAGSRIYISLEVWENMNAYVKCKENNRPLPDGLTFEKLNKGKDYHALGVTLLRIYGYEHLLGDTINDQLNFLRMTQRLDLPGVPADIRRIIIGLIHPNIKQRMNTATALRLLGA